MKVLLINTRFVKPFLHGYPLNCVFVRIANSYKKSTDLP